MLSWTRADMVEIIRTGFSEEAGLGRLVSKLLAEDAMMCYATKITERAPAESPAERLGACKFLPGQSPLQRILNVNLFGHKCV
jgi:hypothetical protein